MCAHATLSVLVWCFFSMFVNAQIYLQENFFLYFKLKVIHFNSVGSFFKIASFLAIWISEKDTT